MLNGIMETLNSIPLQKKKRYSDSQRKNWVGVMRGMFKFRASHRGPNILINSGISQKVKSPGLFLVEHKKGDKKGLGSKKMTLRVVRFPGGYF